ncbi:Alpha/Beta hydrolase protein [Mycena amicta]|nr:Alpha/Beta hydrolase protein [Mycena amicta]
MSDLKIPDPELALALSSGQTPKFFTGGVAGSRTQLAERIVPAVHAAFGPRLPAASAYKLANHTVEADGGTITVRSVTPCKGEDAADISKLELPVLVWFHGGGWVMGDLDLDDYQLRLLAMELQIVIVNVDYRLAPEHNFPTPLNDAYAAVKWTVDNATKIGASIQNGLVIGGFSAGGNLTAAIANRSRNDPFFTGAGNNIIFGQVLHAPALIHPAAYPEHFKAELMSYAESVNAPLLDTAGLDLAYDNYGGIPTDPEVSPLLDPHTHAGVVPTFIQVGGLDPLCDEGLLYARVLREAGVQVKCQAYAGAPHGFQYLFPESAVAKQWEADLHAGIQWVLNPSRD